MADVEGWADGFSQVEDLLAPRFRRSEPRARAAGYVQGLMAPLERKNGWMSAKLVRLRSP